MSGREWLDREGASPPRRSYGAIVIDRPIVVIFGLLAFWTDGAVVRMRLLA